MVRDPSTYRNARRNNWRTAWSEPPQPPARRFSLKWQDAVPLLALPLGFAAMVSENNTFVGICFSLSGVIACAPVIWHQEWPKKYRGIYCLAVMVVCGGLFFAVASENRKRELALNEGYLEPADETVPPPANCPPPTSNAIAVFLGPTPHYIVKSPQRVIVIQGEEILTLAEQDSKIKISLLRLFDRHNNIFARIDSNGFWIRNDVRKKHPDLSTLIIYDTDDNEALNIKFLNPKALSINGIFRYGTAPPVIVTPSLLQAGGVRDHGSCSIGPAGVFLDVN